MLTTTPYLSKEQYDQLAPLIHRIAKAVQPEKIICYGHRMLTTQKWGCFAYRNGFMENKGIAFDLLIITPDNEKRAPHEIVQLAEQQCPPAITVICVAHKITAVNAALQDGSYFFGVLFSRGVLLYEASATPLVSPGDSFAGYYSPEIAEACWTRWYGMAKQFLALAVHALSCGWSDQAIFLLHQAVEHTCIALLRAITNYRSNTHNIGRLLAMIENFSEKPVSIFPRSSKEENDLFNLLLNGYGDPRYKEQYKVTLEITTALIGRVEQLQAVANEIFQEKAGG